MKPLQSSRSHLTRGILLLAIVALSGCKKEFDQQMFPGSTEISNSVSGRSVKFVPNELMVKFTKGTSGEDISKSLLKIDGVIAEKILTKAMETFGDYEGIYRITTPLGVTEAVTLIKTEAGIEYAEPNFIYHHDATFSDPLFANGTLWGMYGSSSTPDNQYGSQAALAWADNKTGSKTITIGVIDEGAMFDHEDLAGNFWTNPTDVKDGVDNDDNGYIDDVNGWDFANGDASIFDGTSDDHGTHVSGTIGARGNNDKGVAGVNWSISMISAKFLGRNGGTSANAVKAVDYITNLKIRHGLQLPATNNSWGGGGFSQSLKDAIDRAGKNNILFIAAAGNDGLNTDQTISYPSGYNCTNIIAVAAITSDGRLASYSNYGSISVDIGAPGSVISSTTPGKGKSSSTYSSYSGTSMAAPHVTGAVALYASQYPRDNASQIKNAILSSAISTPSLSGKCVTGGRLNVYGSLTKVR